MRLLKYLDRERRYALYAFLASLFCALLIFAITSIYPFGPRTLLSMDAWSQYFPMMMEGKDGLSQWSFSGALGFNRLAESAYYTMSPLFWIVYLFPKSAMYAVLHLVIALKFALAGLFFYLFLAKRYRPSPVAIAFSLAYAFSAYTIAFLNQFMWMDAVVLLPLVALGLERLAARKAPLLYILSLGLTLYSCFYIGYMVCIFSVLYFLILLLRERRTLRERGGSLALFSVSSLLAGGLAAFVLLPTYLCLQGTVASTLSFDGVLRTYHSFLTVIKQFYPFGQISLEFQAPNLYCGSLSLFLFLLSVFLPKKPLRERLILIFLALFIYFSCTLNILDFVWHGMHYPNQLPGRQSFIFTFFIVSEAYAALLSLAEGDTARREESGEKPRRRFRPAALGLALLLAGEVFANAAYAVGFQTWTCPIGSYTYFDAPMEKVAATYSEGPWRSEKISCFNFNAGQLYRYHGISFYSSTMQSDAYRFFEDIGMGVYAQNVSTLYEPSNILNMLFGVRYLHAYNGDTPDGLYLDEVETIDTVTVYENRYCLPLAFAASPDALTVHPSNGGFTPMTVRNEMLRSLLGDSVGYYEEEGALAAAYARLSAGGMQIDSFSDSHIVGTVRSAEDALLFTSIPHDRGWTVRIDGEKVETVTVFDYLLAVPLEAGEHTVELSYTAPGFTAGLVISLVSLAAVLAIAVWEQKKRKEITQ